MATLPGLVTELSLDNRAFVRNLTRSAAATESSTFKIRQSLRNVERSTARTAKAFGQLRAGVGALAGALAVRQFTQFTRAAIDSADAIAKQADRIGLSTKALQEYRLVAGLAGVETAKLDQGFGAFTKRLGELRAGTGALNTILNKGNIELKGQLIAAESTDEALRLFLGTLAATADQADRVALSAAAFSRTAGIELANLVKNGAAEVENMRAQMSQLGLVIEERVLRSAEKLGDNISLLQSALKTGFNVAIIENLAGAVDASAASLLNAREIGEQFGRAVGETMQAVATGAQFLAENMREILIVLGSIAAFKAARLFGNIAVAVGNWTVSMLAAARAGAGLGAIFAAVNPLAAVVGLAAGAVALLATRTSVAEEAAKRHADAIKLVQDALTSAGPARVQAIEDARRATRAALDEAEAQLAALEARQAGLRGRAAAAAPQIGADIATLRKRIAELRGDMVSLEAAGESALEAFGGIGPTVAKWARATKEADAATKALLKRRKETLETVRAENQQLGRLIQVQGRGETAINAVADAIESENVLRKLGLTLQDDLGQAIDEEVRKRAEQRRALEDITDAQQEATRAAEKAAEEQKRLAEQRAQIIAEPFKNAVEGIQRSFVEDFDEFPDAMLADPAFQHDAQLALRKAMA